MRLRHFSLAALSLCLFPLACGGGVEATPPKSDASSVASAGSGGAGGFGGGGAGGSGGAEPEPIVWLPCPLDSNSEVGAEAECAEIQVPLDHNSPSGETIPLFVKRLLAKGPARAQLWMLQGGPGAAGNVFDAIAPTIAARDAGVDVYFPDHRGTGRSSRLRCVAEDAGSPGGQQVLAAEFPACIDDLVATWGDKLGLFNITQAAEDVGLLVARTRAEGQGSFVYGVSYGTAWAQRYLQLFPEQSSGVVLDSMVPPSGFSLGYQDQWFEATAKETMTLCAADALCGGKLGPDPWAVLGAFYDKLEAGHCPSLASFGLDRTVTPRVFATLLQNLKLRAIFPALLYRMDRCDSADVDVILHLLLALFQQPAKTTDAYYSLPIAANIVLSEMWGEPPPTLEELEAFDSAAYVTKGLGPYLAGAYEIWPLYPHDAHFGAFAETQTPMLMLHGTSDPATPQPLGDAVGEHFTSPHQTYVLIPHASHGAIFQSPLAADPAVHCGFEVMMQFLSDPEATLDVSCKDTTAPFDFAGSAEVNQLLLGTTDLYENTQSAAAGASPKPASEGLPSLLRLPGWLDAP